MQGFQRLSLAACCFAGLAAPALAAPTIYNVEPGHTYPSFEADHMGISVWRGKFNKSAGRIVYDKANGQGSVDIAVDIDSVDFGHDLMNTKAKSAEIFDAAKFPQAVFKGRFEGFNNGIPSKLAGELTLHGVTRPLTLTINSLKCVPHPMLKRDFCGADAIATFNRAEFGIDAGKAYGFNMDVTLRIQVEGIAAE